MKQHDENEPFFISEEAGAEMIKAGYEFEPAPIACSRRLSSVLERMSDAELSLQPGKVTVQERKYLQNKLFSGG